MSHQPKQFKMTVVIETFENFILTGYGKNNTAKKTVIWTTPNEFYFNRTIQIYLIRNSLTPVEYGSTRLVV